MKINDLVQDKFNHKRKGIIGAIEISFGRYENQRVFVQWDDGKEEWVMKTDLFVSIEDANESLERKD